MKKVIIILVVIILVVGGGFAVRQYLTRQKSPYEFIIAEKQDIIQEVSASGQISSLKTLDLQFKTQGKITAVFVKVGDEVGSGRSLVKLDTSELQIQVQQAEANIDIAKAQRDQALTGATVEEIQVAQTTVTNAEQSLEDEKTEAAEDLADAYEDAQDTIDSGYLKISKALNSIDNVQETYFNGIDQLSHQVKDKIAEAEYSYNQFDTNQSDTDLALIELKVTAGVVSDTLDFVRTSLDDPELTVISADKTTIDTERTNINTALTNITTAQQLISSTKLTGQLNINDAEATLKTAQDNLKLTTADPQQADIDLAQAKVREAQAALALIQNKIKEATLVSPIKAKVTEINSEVGEITTAGQSVIRLLASNFQIEVDIPEADIAKIKEGNLAEITLDAFFDEQWSGKVVTIDPAEDIIQGVVYYQVTIVFDEKDTRIKSGMTANVIIKTDARTNVLAIPYRAIIEKDDKKIVRILSDEKEVKELEEREVEMGLVGSEGWVEILSGLKEGEKVITFIKQK